MQRFTAAQLVSQHSLVNSLDNHPLRPYFIIFSMINVAFKQTTTYSFTSSLLPFLPSFHPSYPTSTAALTTSTTPTAAAAPTVPTNPRI